MCRQCSFHNKAFFIFTMLHSTICRQCSFYNIRAHNRTNSLFQIHSHLLKKKNRGPSLKRESEMAKTGSFLLCNLHKSQSIKVKVQNPNLSDHDGMVQSDRRLLYNTSDPGSILTPGSVFCSSVRFAFHHHHETFVETHCKVGFPVVHSGVTIYGAS